jgi:hypothetical protein
VCLILGKSHDLIYLSTFIKMLGRLYGSDCDQVLHHVPAIGISIPTVPRVPDSRVNAPVIETIPSAINRIPLILFTHGSHLGPQTQYHCYQRASRWTSSRLSSCDVFECLPLVAKARRTKDRQNHSIDRTCSLFQILEKFPECSQQISDVSAKYSLCIMNSKLHTGILYYFFSESP